MTKFNLDFRIKAVTEYLSGESSPALARKYGLSTEEVKTNELIELVNELRPEFQSFHQTSS